MGGEREKDAVEEGVVFGLLVAGFICWFWGRALNRGDEPSHTINFIPIEWLGALIIVANVLYAACDLWETKFGSAPPTELPKPLSAGPWQRRNFKMERLTTDDAIKQYPGLVNLDSAFHAPWAALAKEYRDKQPSYFDSPSWPVELAKEVEKRRKRQ